MTNPKQQAVYDQLCRHLIALRMTYSTSLEGDQRFITRFGSGSLLLAAGRFYFLTAGHVLKELREVATSPKYDVVSTRLVDCFGSDAKFRDPIPFDFDPHTTILLDNDDWGLDFGVIELGPLDVKLLLKNKILAIGRKNWFQQDVASLDGNLAITEYRSSISNHLLVRKPSAYPLWR